jgi:hypothetical protein
MDFGKSNAPDAEQITHPCTKTMDGNFISSDEMKQANRNH